VQLRCEVIFLQYPIVLPGTLLLCHSPLPA
jgi:hypothetical protein